MTPTFAAFAALATMAVAGPSPPEALAALATLPDVTMVPPVGEPSPKAGSFLIPYAAPEGAEPDPKKEGTFGVGPSSCSEMLVFKEVEAANHVEELWAMSSGVGVNIGLPFVKIGASFGTKSFAGVRYDLDHKLILDTGIAQMEECCLRAPDKCTDTYVSEYWHGTGAIHKMQSSESTMKATAKTLTRSGSVDFGSQKGWSMANEWDTPMYFAYRTSAFQIPDCGTYMNDLPEVDGKVLFTGVSQRVLSEQEARENARDDARQQVVRYLGESFSIEGDQAVSSAEAVISGVKDGLICLDEVKPTPEGPSYLARVRMYVASERLEAGMADMGSK